MANYISNEEPLSIPAEKAKQILNSLHEHVLYYDRDMKILWANLAALNSVEISLEKIKEKRCWSVWAQRKTPCDACPVILSMETGSLQCIEKTTPDGRSWLVKGYPLKDKHGNVIGGIETTLDITDRKKTEENLKITFDILNRSPAVGFMWKNAEGWPVIFVTPNVSKLFGYTSDEFISGKISYEKAIYPEDLSRVMEEVRTFSSDKERKEFKHKPYRILSKNGEVKWVLDSTTIDRNNDGDILYYKGIIENITDRIKTDQVIKESEEKYRNLFHHSNDGIFIHDLQGNIIDINQKAIDLLGYTEKEILSLKVHNLHPPEVLEKTKWAFDIDKKGKDSWRHRKAGADIVLIASTDKIAMIKDNDCESLDCLEKYFNGVDLVIAEGYNKENKPKIEIVRAATGKEPICLDDSKLIALVTDSDIVHKVPGFGLEEIDKLADFIERKYL